MSAAANAVGDAPGEIREESPSALGATQFPQVGTTYEELTEQLEAAVRARSALPTQEHDPAYYPLTEWVADLLIARSKLSIAESNGRIRKLANTEAVLERSVAQNLSGVKYKRPSRAKAAAS